MKILVVFLILTFLTPATLQADEALVHPAAHIGMSYALDMVFYGVCTRLNIIKPWDGDYSPEVKWSFPEDNKLKASNRVPCMMASAFTAMMVGFLYKHFECKNGGCDPSQVARSILYNSVGVGLSTGSIVLFKF